MRLDTSMHQRMEQKMILAPRMIQSMEILQLPLMALQERIQQELNENIVLELKEAGTEEAPAVVAEGAPDPEPVPVEPVEVAPSVDSKDEFERFEAMTQWDSSFSEDHRPSRGGLDEEGDRKHDAMQNMASRPQTLQDALNDQLAYFDIPPEKLRLIRYLISHIDDKGWLTASLEELGREFDPPATLPEVEEAREVILRLDPRGVGAQSLQECLLLQLNEELPHADILEVLIKNHWEDLQHNRLPVIQKRTGLSLEQIREALDELRHLNPHPGSSFTSETTHYIVPDIAIERNGDGNYDVRLLDDWTPSISISRYYLEMYKNKAADAKTKEYLKRKIQAAQWLMDSIEQRRSTLRKVTKEIIAHQTAFLDNGPEYIEPLKMQQIAEKVGVHVTTVSRAVAEKWVQTPRGVFPLKRFFGGGTQTASGEEVAWETIKQKLLDLIDKEDKANPLSDEDLVNKLNEAGYPVARRTVTKYRKMLKIPSSRQRKVWSD